SPARSCHQTSGSICTRTAVTGSSSQRMIVIVRAMVSWRSMSSPGRDAGCALFYPGAWLSIIEEWQRARQARPAAYALILVFVALLRQIGVDGFAVAFGLARLLVAVDVVFPALRDFRLRGGRVGQVVGLVLSGI